MMFWETVLLAFLASLFATVIGGLYAIGAFRKRKAKEPPLDKGFIPWLGYGINFKKNPVEFLERMKKKHGDVFTVLVGGNYLHFVMDPHAYSRIIKESKDKLDFNTFASVIVFNAFDFHTSESHHKIVQTISKKYLNGKNLAVLNQVMMEKLETVMLHSQGSGGRKRSWQQDGVLHFSYKTIFQAAFLTLFGTDPDQHVAEEEKAGENNLMQCGELFDDFKKFDNFFPQMALSLLDPLGKKETQRLKHIFWNVLSVEKVYRKNNISSWVTEQDRQMAEIGMTEKMRAQFLFLLLWASQANTGPATFWILVHLLKYPEAMKAVRKELDNALREIGQEIESDSPMIHATLNMMKTPLLDSAIQETLRLKASPFLFRSVMQDTNIKMADGREYVLRKGDHLLLFPYISLHMDPEIHPDPQRFKYDRFLNLGGTKQEFYKNGKKLKHYSMPFGAGPSMCPGRFFAVSEMKMFVILMLTYFDMELVNSEEEIPPVDGSRYGFGTTHPSHDIQFRYRLRV
ncbi:5-beta-cholestane-3-alpha,7-alpha-diol 12-alpha-hydroxylase-like [Sceloporus undulatus]|uniref:5-beta-cholestane-3-alpha,7-alpha-diol 12-alpha-hydroxylase-like n=1 Tax=Sceloporus undulatus TaxID=8520 RepID=UPI001C4B1AA2|nr:5-beta-cholestane-3-alpha,7-alpha-diol 12-alpha-hydroxylase-like [Sceloporus undulatus]